MCSNENRKIKIERKITYKDSIEKNLGYIGEIVILEKR